MRIRSITLHLSGDIDTALVERFLAAAETFRPLTIRVSVLPAENSVEYAVEKLQSLGVKYISALHFRYDAETMYRYVSRYYVFGTFSDPAEYLKFLKILYRKGEIYLSRYVSLMLGGVVYNSPYFPASISTKTGISVALLYPNDLSQIGDVEKILKVGQEVGHRVASTVGVDFLGVDGSLSPWGEESVAKAVERLFKIRLGHWGSRHAISQLNNAIRNADVLKTGFNEVMLPVAEDEELKRLVEAGLLDLEKLVGYTSVCVPGLDMVPLRIRDWGAFERLLYDLAALAESKRRPIGVRVFPVDVDEYYIEGFGRTPAVELK